MNEVWSVVPTAEEAHPDAGAGGGIDFAPPHGVEQRRPGVLRCPDRRIARGDDVPVLPQAPRHDVHNALSARLGFGKLAEEVVLLRGGEAVVAVGAADQADLEGIDAQFRLVGEPQLEGAAAVLVLQHPVFLGCAAADVVPIPVLEIGKFVVRRQERMRLAIALDLGDFVNRLPTGAETRVLRANRLAIHGLRREHHAVGQVAVVRHGEDLAASLLLVAGQRLP